jgi:predicted transcriptional regulator
MSIISLRLPDELEDKLTREAELANRPRSELARDAIAYYLDRLERERFLARMESAARALAADPDSRNEALQTAKDFLPLDNEALALGERQAEYKLSRTGRTRPKKRKS